MEKKFGVEQTHINIIESVKFEKSFSTNSEALRFIIEQYEINKHQKSRDDEIINRFLEAFHEKYYTLFERLRWASQMSEKNSTIILDAINTLLFAQNVNDVILTDSLQTPVVKESAEIYKSKIAHFKQKKDERKRKKNDG